MAEERKTVRRGRRWVLWTAGSMVVVLAALTGTVIFLAYRVEPYLRALIVEELSERFHSKVEFDSFHVRIAGGLDGQWGVWARGRGLRIWPPAEVAGVEIQPAGRANYPLIQLAEFDFHTPLRYSRRMPIYISEVKLKGLVVHLPPRPHFLAIGEGSRSPSPSMQPGSRPGPVQFQLGDIDCSDAHVVLETTKPGKLPMEIDIAHFTLTDIAFNAAMHYQAELTNPLPVGFVHTKGILGPWQVNDPGQTPVAGDYRFDHADLGNFRGIAGILNSTGRYTGTLRGINVEGETDTPDFRLAHFEHPVALHTKFHAIVDGTDGDTHLDPVDATLGHSHIVAKGQVVRALTPGGAGTSHGIGHDIRLVVNVPSGRIEDFVRLASRAPTPVLTGVVQVTTTFHIPPGEGPVNKRMELNGKFALEQAQFTSQSVQNRLEELSLRGQGRPHDVKSAAPDSVTADMNGDFRIERGILTLPNLAFDVPGADIRLHGTYTLEGGGLDFAGTARMQATISRMVGGWKGFLLKPADKFFKKDGAGTEIPVHVRGTRDHPDFGVDLKRIKHTSPERPDQQPGQPPVRAEPEGSATPRMPSAEQTQRPPQPQDQ